MSKKKENNSSVKLVLTQMVLDIFEKNAGTPFNYKQVSAKLNVNDPESREIIYEILKEEAQKNVLKEVSHGKFQVIELKTFVEGKVDMTADGSAFIVTDDESETDIFVGPRKLRNALNGDRVKVYVYAKSKGSRKEGEVIEILQRNKMEFTGIVKLSERFAFFIPDDRKMMHDIFIPISDINGAKNGIKAVAEITDWRGKTFQRSGELRQVIGSRPRCRDRDIYATAIRCCQSCSSKFIRAGRCSSPRGRRW